MNINSVEIASTPFLVVWSLTVGLLEYLGQISIVITLRRKHRIWIDRLEIFDLGLPDGASQPEAEMLKQLREEIARNRFNESLLERDDFTTIVKTQNLDSEWEE